MKPIPVKTMWKDIVSAAIVGTSAKRPRVAGEGDGAGQAGAPHPADGLERLLAGISSSDPESCLLAAAGAAALWKLAGHRLTTDSHPLPEVCEYDTAPALGAAATGFLEIMLAGVHSTALPEFLEAAGQAGKRAPNELLPELLDLAARDRTYRQLALNVIGRRGIWLAERNPSWRAMIAGRDDDSAWETGNRDERLAVLSALRETNPARGRELLASTWNQEPPKDRVAFLRTFEVGLGPADEAFLEAALSDNRIEVRRLACDLLLGIPSSRASHALAEIAFSMIELKTRIVGGNKFEISIPQDLAKMLRDKGIEFEPAVAAAASKTMGEKGTLLYQIASVLPPARWCEHFGKDSATLVQAMVQSDWNQPLVAGLTVAVGVHPDVAWTETLIRRYLRQGGAGVMLQPFPHSAIAALPEDRAESLILEALNVKPIGYNHPVFWLVKARRHAWSEKLSRAVVGSIKQQIEPIKEDVAYSSPAEMIRQCSLFAPAGLAAEFSSGWPPHIRNLPRLDAIVEEFVTLLTFRRDMLKAIQGD